MISIKDLEKSCYFQIGFIDKDRELVRDLINSIKALTEVLKK